jgi:regulator of sigma E protease
MTAALLAALGFMALIVLHEIGHFVVAKLVGMRVERFALFFPPLVWRRKGKGETEYALGAIPLGGYVKISGMNPHEELPPEVQHRAYYRQKPWKRIAVILAGPLVNIVIAFAIYAGLVLDRGVPTNGTEVVAVEQGLPAEGVLRPGDRVVAVDGREGTARELSEQIATHRCPGDPAKGCRAETPAALTIERDGQTLVERVRPVFDPVEGRMRVGFQQRSLTRDTNVIEASERSLDWMWFVTRTSVDRIVGILDAEKRKDISGIVGSYETTRQAFQLDIQTALLVLALISLSLGVVNLFPFLPLDGGHVFWAVAEKVRRKPIPFSVMEKSGFVGFALVLMLFAIGFTNDLERLAGPGFDLTR